MPHDEGEASQIGEVEKGTIGVQGPASNIREYALETRAAGTSSITEMTEIRSRRTLLVVQPKACRWEVPARPNRMCARTQDFWRYLQSSAQPILRRVPRLVWATRGSNWAAQLAS